MPPIQEKGQFCLKEILETPESIHAPSFHADCFLLIATAMCETENRLPSNWPWRNAVTDCSGRTSICLVDRSQQS